MANLGNTCYLNSTLQTLRSIPELQTALSKYEYKQNNLTDQIPQLDLTRQLKDLYKYMSETQDSMQPVAFLSALRLAYPQFAERSKTGHGYAQQDAEEAWSQIVSQLNQKLKTEGNDQEESISFMNKYMGGEFESTLECDDPAAAEGGEKPVTAREPFIKLSCHIDSQTNHLRDGIVNGLKEQIEKEIRGSWPRRDLHQDIQDLAPPQILDRPFRSLLLEARPAEEGQDFAQGHLPGGAGRRRVLHPGAEEGLGPSA